MFQQKAESPSLLNRLETGHLSIVVVVLRTLHYPQQRLMSLYQLSQRTLCYAVIHFADVDSLPELIVSRSQHQSIYRKDFNTHLLVFFTLYCLCQTSPCDRTDSTDIRIGARVTRDCQTLCHCRFYRGRG